MMLLCEGGHTFPGEEVLWESVSEPPCKDPILVPLCPSCSGLMWPWGVEAERLVIVGEVYNVGERWREAFGPSSFLPPPDWWEYEARLVCCECGEVVDEWDSAVETFDGDLRHCLTQEEAERALREVLRGVPKDWFNRTCCVCRGGGGEGDV